MLAILLITLSGITSKPLTTVDVIEVNHVYYDGSHAYDQVILWEWSPDYRRYDVLAWWLISKASDMPQRKNGVWHVKEYKSGVFIETFGPDRERANKELRPEQTRRKL